MRVALGTNILVYAEALTEGPGEAGKAAAAAQDLLERLRPEAWVLPVQVLGELFWVLRRKGRPDGATARARVAEWRRFADLPQPTTETVLDAALDLAAAHGLQVWDAVMLAAAAEARCAFLLSEDLQPGFAQGGVLGVNPLAGTPLPPRLAAALHRP